MYLLHVLVPLLLLWAALPGNARSDTTFPASDVPDLTCVNQDDSPITVTKGLFGSLIDFLISILFGGGNPLDGVNLNGTNNWYCPMGSRHFYRSMYEFVKRNPATTEAALSNAQIVFHWGMFLNADYETWSMYGTVLPAIDVCTPIEDGDDIIFHCRLTYTKLLGGVYTLVNDFKNLYRGTDMLVFSRCNNGQLDWYVSSSTKNLTTSQIDIVQNVTTNAGFNWSNVQYQSYPA